VIDMQPIMPAVSGGRLRLLGLYGTLQPGLSCRYIGSYDWPGEEMRSQQLTATLHELVVPLSQDHFKAVEQFSAASGSQSIVDTLFHLCVPASPDYIRAARQAIEECHVVVFSHPWAYPALATSVGHRPVIYDSHNVEALLKSQGLSRSAIGNDALRAVVAAEGLLADRAQRIFACSTQDKNALALLYGIDLGKIDVVPNGCFPGSVAPAPHEVEKRMAGRRQAVFMGSLFGPNVEAAQYIVESLAGQFPDLDFTIVGGAGDNPRVKEAAAELDNVRLLGVIDDGKKRQVLAESDFALNPMVSGSGTNLKMFDFMAAKLPVLTTPVGARGISTRPHGGIVVADLAEFGRQVARLGSMPGAQLRSMGDLNHAHVLKEFDWDVISRRVGSAISKLAAQPALRTTLAPSADVPSSPLPPPRDARKLAIVSTFGIRCGIAGYAASLAEALVRGGHQVHVVAADTPNESPAPASASISVSIGWHFDNATWVGSRFVPEEVLGKTGGRREVDHINVQYHPGFFSVHSLVDFLNLANGRGIATSVTLHNTKAIARQDMEILLAQGSLIFQHDRDHPEFAGGSPHVRYLPHGGPDIADQFGAGIALPDPEPNVIGTFGFLRPHKGVRALIEALPAIRLAVPTAKLRACCALYPSPDSEREKLACEEAIALLGLRDAVEFDTSYNKIEAILATMAKSTVNILPYLESDEGASGAASICLGSRRPLLTSSAGIFGPLGGSAYRFEDVTPAGIALSVLNVLTSPPLQSHLEQLATSYVKANSWTMVARRFSSALFT